MCKGFHGAGDELLGQLRAAFVQLRSRSQPGDFAAFRLFDAVPAEFREAVRASNARLLGAQCHFLRAAVSLCHEPSFAQHFALHKDAAAVARKATYELWSAHFKLSSRP